MDEIKRPDAFTNVLGGIANGVKSRKSELVFYALLIFILLLLFWAAVAEIDELTRGEGKVIPSSRMQYIQSLDGGIVEKILVSEGAMVEKNQPLIIIDDTRYKATFEENEQSVFSKRAMQARLECESLYDPYADEAPDFASLGDDQNLLAYIRDEQGIFLERTGLLKKELGILNSQKKQKLREKQEIESRMGTLLESLRYIKEHKDMTEELVAVGSTSKVELLKLEREYNDLKGEYDRSQKSVQRMNEALRELDLKKEERIISFRSDAIKELGKINAEIGIINAKMTTDNDRLDHTVMRSPVKGIVNKININTVGGVVKSGDELMEIVPLDDSLLVEARISPSDIAFIAPGQTVTVKLTAYDFAIYGALHGEIVGISPDTVFDEAKKESFYIVYVRTDANKLEKNGSVLPIIPGMIANVDILTGKKSILDYIFKPVFKTVQNSMHER
jgi:adhesin transport system membrane fusion protein